MQTTVDNEYKTVYEGLEVSTPDSFRTTALAQERIFFGKGVSILATDMAFRPKGKLFTAGEQFFGVAIADTTLEREPDPITGLPSGAPYGSWRAKKPVTVKRKGRIWVISDTAVDSRAKSVYVRNTDNVGTPASITSDVEVFANFEGITVTLTMHGFAPQAHVLTAAAAASLAAAAAELNNAFNGVKVSVVGGHLVFTTDEVGEAATIAIADNAAVLEFGAPVDGTGVIAIYPAGARGSFRCYTAGQSVSGFTELTSGVKWVSGKTENAQYFGLLELDLI